MRLYNTLTRRVERFIPRRTGEVRIYTCGPTVYRDVHLGNLRSFLMADLLRRTLEALGYRVTQVKNITDVGHMRQELLERGGDKIILAALREGKTPGEIAEFYTRRFLEAEAKLNILPAHHFPRATEHVPDMVRLTETLLRKGHAYEVEGNVYFRVSSFPSYGALSGNVGDQMLTGVRGEADPLKEDPRDFALWKRAEPGREMKWPSPWGEGFPGWHIECSAMSLKYLGPHIDIHTGGVDNVFPHHEDERAQSDAGTGTQVVRFWVHGQHLLVNGQKMSKSLGNVYTLDDITARGHDPLAFRYLCLTCRYRHRLNFTFSALKSAEVALTRLRDRIWHWRAEGLHSETHLPPEAEAWRRRFWDRARDDLDTPGALAVMWQMLRGNLHPAEKLALLLDYDRLLGLGLQQVSAEHPLPVRVRSDLRRRESLRRAGDFPGADALRASLERRGYVVRDTPHGTLCRRRTPFELRRPPWRTWSSSREVPSFLGLPDACDVTFVVASTGGLTQVRRCVTGILARCTSGAVEVVAIDNDSPDRTGRWLEDLALRDPRVRVLHTDHALGAGAVLNLGLKQARGRIVAIVDPCVDVRGDLLPHLERLLSLPRVGVAGPWGLGTQDMRHFYPLKGPGEAEAMQFYLFAFPRRLLPEVGLLRESFRFYRNLDLDFSFQFRAQGYRIYADPSLPVVRYRHRTWYSLTPEQREALSRRNFMRFLKRWHHYADILTGVG